MLKTWIIQIPVWLGVPDQKVERKCWGNWNAVLLAVNASSIHRSCNKRQSALAKSVEQKDLYLVESSLLDGSTSVTHHATTV